MKRRWHLTEREKREIARLALRGEQSSAIARKLGIGRDTVIRFRQKAGLPHGWPAVPEQAILTLLCIGCTVPEIHRKLRVSVPNIYRVAKKYKFQRPNWRTIDARHHRPGLREAIREAVHQRDDFAVHLAEKFGVAIPTVLAVAHEELGKGAFRGGLSFPPLSSAFPQRKHKAENRYTERRT